MWLVTRNISASCSGNALHACRTMFQSGWCSKKNSPLLHNETNKQINKTERIMINFSSDAQCWLNAHILPGCYCRGHKAKESVNTTVIFTAEEQMDYLDQRVGGCAGREGKERQGWGHLITVQTGSSLGRLMEMFQHWLFYDFTRTKLKTHQDVIPISCLTEFPNVVQMAKVRKHVFVWTASIMRKSNTI